VTAARNETGSPEPEMNMRQPPEVGTVVSFGIGFDSFVNVCQEHFFATHQSIATPAHTTSAVIVSDGLVSIS